MIVIALHRRLWRAHVVRGLATLLDHPRRPSWCTSHGPDRSPGPDLAGHFLWPFLRITGLFLTAPLYGSSSIPAQVKSAPRRQLCRRAGHLAAGSAALPGRSRQRDFAGVYPDRLRRAAGHGDADRRLRHCLRRRGGRLSMGLGFAELQFRGNAGITPVLYDIMSWAGLLGFMAAPAGRSGCSPPWPIPSAHGIGTGAARLLDQPRRPGGRAVQLRRSGLLPVLAVSLCVNLTVGLTTVFAPQHESAHHRLPAARSWPGSGFSRLDPATRPRLPAPLDHRHAWSVTAMLPHG